jgi:hypothetical protein
MALNDDTRSGAGGDGTPDGPTDAERLRRLEAENAELRRQIEDLTAELQRRTEEADRYQRVLLRYVPPPAVTEEEVLAAVREAQTNSVTLQDVLAEIEQRRK